MIAVLLFSLQFKPVQTYVAKKAADYLSKELNTTISLSGLYLKPFKSVVLEDFLILDQEKDTLLSMPQLMVDMNDFSLKRRIIDVNTIQLNNGIVHLKILKSGKPNFNFIVDYFDKGGEPQAPKKPSKPYKISFDRIILNNVDFKYVNQRSITKVQGVNFEDVHLASLNGIFEKLNTTDHLMQANIKNLTFKEKSGFYLKNLTAFTTVDTNQIELKNLRLVTNQSRLTDYFQMKFASYNDFNDYFNKVRMKANFKDSHLASRDVAFFAPQLGQMNLNLDIDGAISGLVTNLRAKALSVKAGKATYIKGDFIVKGLPNLNDTYMDLKIDMLGTNKKDLDQLLRNTTGKSVKNIPDIISKFGNINFNGQFTGFQNDFIAFGEFKTKLGRVVSDVNMKINKAGVPSYSGNVKTYDFNIGNLLDKKLLGRVTASVNIEGVGTEIKNLKEKINGKIDYIDFKDYRYRNALVNGTFNKQLFDGSLKLNDKNIKLVFDGSVDLNPKLPVFNFNATVKEAKLKAIKLLKDSLKIDAVFSTNFTGNNLNNIQGNLVIEKVKLTNPKGVYNIDSLQLKAQGIGTNRELTIQSDVFDASIKGQYDLNSIPAYYQALAKTYIPSLKTSSTKYNAQIFQFNLMVKRFEPIAELVAPGLEIEEQAVLVGNFNSKENIATLNGFVKKIKYKGITVNNLILDENTTTNQLQAIITSDRVDLNDSLYIKNVNISNVLRNDSLALNVKLSNAEDDNQLDLNGLVEFATDTSRVSILPSILKINNEDWAIQEKVRINFKDGKTAISNFELSNGEQLLTVDGQLSNDPKDILLLGFKNFNLSTLNPFTKTLGIKLYGKVNGDTKLSSLLAAPKINDNITIDSLMFNDTYIGSLADTSSFDKTKSLATIYTRILTNDAETFRLDGSLDLNEKLIDLDVIMKESKLAILEPFVKSLVSGLKGNISSDIKVRGSFSNPKINGSITLDQAQLTVNYLKTAYTISQTVDVENSVVVIDDLQLKDMNGSTATANGSVNLNDITNPVLDIDIDARNFMALNTTAKDNPLYFGQAYASGNFRFKGPTNQMYIGIDAKAEKGTIFNLPLNSSETVSSKDFITFVPKDTARIVKKATTFEGLTMSFKLSIDPNTTANIFTTLGNLSGKGNADLNLEINSYGDFEMSGDYVIESGNFDFTAQEVINKKFTIRQGGSIRWTGNPLNAQIQLKAIYSLRASLSDLYTAANRTSTNNAASARVLTEVEMGLSGLLLKPDIKLDIFFPSDPGIKEEFQAYFNDSNNMNLQALSLIIRRSFAPGSGADLGEQLTSGVTSTATELLFNQFNNVLSSLNLDFVDINIRSFSEANASFKFFNDRIVLNAGIVDRRSNNDLSLIGFSKNNVGGEVEILALIKKDGSLVGKLANKPPTQQNVFITSGGINQNNNVTSLGLIYTQQFDSFREFTQKITGEYKKNQLKKAAKEQADKEKEEKEKAEKAAAEKAAKANDKNLPKTEQPLNKEAVLDDKQKKR